MRFPTGLAIDANEFRDDSISRRPSLSIPGWSSRSTDLVSRVQRHTDRRPFPNTRAYASPARSSTPRVTLRVSSSRTSRSTARHRRQPHEMRRFTALAIDNIRRNPVAYPMACRPNARVSSCRQRRPVYGRQSEGVRNHLAGGAVSIVYLTLALAGLAGDRAKDAPVHDPCPSPTRR